MMADPIPGVIALATFALTASAKLYTTVRDFQSKDKKARALKVELGDLTAVLQSLLETTSNNPDIDFEALSPVLHRCGNACKEYGDLISCCPSRSASTPVSVRDWVTQKYLQGDITEFMGMVAGYKATINIALVNVNLRVAVITPGVLEDYKDMISDTSQDLEEHLQKLDAKIRILSHGDAQYADDSNIEWQAILAEKKSTQLGLRSCTELSAQIAQLEPAPEEHSQFSYRPSAHIYVRNGLDVAKSSIQNLVLQLRDHEEVLNRRMEAMVSTATPSEDVVTELMKLEETKESLRQCTKIISNADKTLDTERQNVSEDITLGDNAYNFTVSTVGDLVTARQINLSGRSRNVGGQISDESYQKTSDAFAKYDIRAKGLPQELDQAVSTTSP